MMQLMIIQLNSDALLQQQPAIQTSHRATAHQPTDIIMDSVRKRDLAPFLAL